MVQAGRRNTRLSEISLLQPVQGFVEISKRFNISYIGTAEGRKGYLQSILIYYILYIHYVYPGRGTLTGDLYYINFTRVLRLIPYLMYEVAEMLYSLLNTQHTSDPDVC